MADTLDLFGGGDPDPAPARLDPVAAKKQREAIEYMARKTAPPPPAPSVNALCVHPGCGQFGPWGWLPTNSRWCTLHLPEWWKAHGTPLAL